MNCKRFSPPVCAAEFSAVAEAVPTAIPKLGTWSMVGAGIVGLQRWRRQRDQGKKRAKVKFTKTAMIGPTSWFKSWRFLALCAVVVLGSTTSAVAGIMHATAKLGSNVQRSIAGHNGAAHADVGDIFTVCRAHEELGYNYIDCADGRGHAHHHKGLFNRYLPADNQDDNSENLLPNAALPTPMPGSPGTSLYVLQTWLPNASGNEITVTWSPDSFLQVDLSELTPGNSLASLAILTADGGLVGSVELSAWLDDRLGPQIATRLTGIFGGLAFELGQLSPGIVSLQFRQPLTWTVPGEAETFDIALDGSINGVLNVPEPVSILLVAAGLVLLSLNKPVTVKGPGSGLASCLRTVNRSFLRETWLGSA